MRVLYPSLHGTETWTANIGQSLLEHAATSEAKDRDIRDIGRLMLKLMELSTSLFDPESLTLRNPERWGGAIKNFLQITQTATSEDLRKVRDIYRQARASLTYQRTFFSRSRPGASVSSPWSSLLKGRYRGIGRFAWERRSIRIVTSPLIPC